MTDTALIIDTETDQGRDPRPIQVATINVATGFEWMKYFNSGRPISPVVIRIHGITDDDVAGLERCPDIGFLHTFAEVHSHLERRLGLERHFLGTNGGGEVILHLIHRGRCG